MIRKVIDNPSKLQLVRDVFNANVKDMCKFIRKDFNAFACTYGINVCEDKYGLYVNISVDKYVFYAIIRSDLHRITCEYGVKVRDDKLARFTTRRPKNLKEYMYCNDIAMYCIKSIYEVNSLGEIKRNDNY